MPIFFHYKKVTFLQTLIRNRDVKSCIDPLVVRQRIPAEMLPIVEAFLNIGLMLLIFTSECNLLPLINLVKIHVGILNDPQIHWTIPS